MGGLLILVAGPVLLVLGGFGVWWTVRLFRRRAVLGGLAVAIASGVSLLAGLAISASAALLILYALNHNPPRGEIVEDTAPAPAAP